MAFVQRSADQQQRHLRFKINFWTSYSSLRIDWQKAAKPRKRAARHRFRDFNVLCAPSNFLNRQATQARNTEAFLHWRRTSRHTRDVQRTTRGIARSSAELQRTVKVSHEFKNSTNTMVNNMDILEKHLQRKIQERN